MHLGGSQDGKASGRLTLSCRQQSLAGKENGIRAKMYPPLLKGKPAADVCVVQTPSCDGMGPQNNRHVGDGSYCRAEDYLSPAERAATLGV